MGNSKLKFNDANVNHFTDCTTNEEIFAMLFSMYERQHNRVKGMCYNTMVFNFKNAMERSKELEERR